MTLKKLKPGMTVYEVNRATGLSKVLGQKWTASTIHIKEIDEENERVLAYGYGQVRWWHKNEWSKWRLKGPEY